MGKLFTSLVIVVLIAWTTSCTPQETAAIVAVESIVDIVRSVCTAADTRDMCLMKVRAAMANKFLDSDAGQGTSK